jgi:hypothetical protein
VAGERPKAATALGASKALESPAAVIAALWNHPVIASGAGGRKSGWPELRPEEMADLVALLQSLGWTR